MGLFWDLIQQGQISDQRRHAESLAAQSRSLEQRVIDLERELAETRRQLQQLLHILENHVGQDLNQDGKVGG